MEWRVWFADGSDALYCESHMHKLMRAVDKVEPLPGVGTHATDPVVSEWVQEAQMNPPGQPQPDRPTGTVPTDQ